MGHRFVIVVAGQLCEFTRYEDIPDEFDRVIEFMPEIPLGPHTKEQHDEIDSWIPKFTRLMEIENGSSRKSR